MTDKELKSKIADIIMEAIEEYNSNEINRPMIASVYAGEIISFINSLPEEPMSEDLDKAAERDVCGVVNNCSAIGMPNDHIPSWVQDAMINEFIHGAKWKEEQLMDNVVLETEVLRDSDGDGVDTPYESWLTLANTEIPELPESLGLEEGDKVKVIIVKED